MKIGIITWFQTPNYGTNLQAIALQKYLRNKGHNVYLVNFKTKSSSATKKRSFMQKLKNQPQKYADKFAFKKYNAEIEKKNKAIERIISQECLLTRKIVTEQDYIDVCNGFDLLIFGSDQIWNPNFYNKFYYAYYPEITAKKAAYAPSLGISKMPEQMKNLIGDSLSDFSAISVRETQGAEILAQILSKKPQVVLDPTFLLSREEWAKIAEKGTQINKDYVLCMYLTDNIRYQKASVIFSKKKNLPLITVPYLGFSYFQKGQIIPDAGIEDLLNLIQHAKYVITDSFHITVFSLIFQRDFFTFQRFNENSATSQNSRVENLLSMLKLDDRLLEYFSSSIPEKESIDYTSVNEILQSEILKSKQFLDNVTGG